MKILITGSTGFIGKNLINNKFFLKHKILLINSSKINKNKNILKSKIQNINLKINQIKSFNPEAVIHLAWYGIPDYGKEISKQNYKHQIKFFETLKKVKSIKKIIVTGSCFEYGTLSGKANERKKIKKYNFFSKAKLNIYKYITNNFPEETKIIWLRLFYVYGNKQRDNALIPYLIKALKSNINIDLNEPFAAKDFVNVNDVNKIIIKCLSINRQGVFNVGTGTPYSPLEIINIILKKIKSKSKINYDKTKKKTKFYASIKKLNSIYPYRQLNLKKTIHKLIKEF